MSREENVIKLLAKLKYNISEKENNLSDILQ